MKRRIFDWICHPVSCVGAGNCAWLGIVMLLNLRWNMAPALFPPEPVAVFVIMGASAVAIGVAGLLDPGRVGFTATMLVCGERGWQAWETHNCYPIGVWTVLAVSVIAWDFFVLPKIRSAIAPCIPTAWGGAG